MAELQLSLLEDSSTGATFSPCRKYRYTLWREWDSSKGTCVFIGLNPSTADETEDDPTIRRCINFCKKWGYGKYIMLNIFAYRATDPQVMKNQGNPNGADNDKVLLDESNKADCVIAAWGNHGAYKNRGEEVSILLKGIDLQCLKISKDDFPAHPLYQPGDAQRVKYLIR